MFSTRTLKNETAAREAGREWAESMVRLIQSYTADDLVERAAEAAAMAGRWRRFEADARAYRADALDRFQRAHFTRSATYASLRAAYDEGEASAYAAAAEAKREAVGPTDCSAGDQAVAS